MHRNAQATRWRVDFGNLASDGFELLVRDPDERRAATAAASGARVCDDVAAVARDAEVTFLSLPTPDDVDEVGAEWLAAARADAVLVDLSTNAPSRVRWRNSRIG